MSAQKISWSDSNANQLRMIRAKEKLTQKELAEKIGVRRETISVYERCGRETVRLNTYLKIINYLTDNLEVA